jgi:hypothetical protein
MKGIQLRKRKKKLLPISSEIILKILLIAQHPPIGPKVLLAFAMLAGCLVSSRPWARGRVLYTVPQ